MGRRKGTVPDLDTQQIMECIPHRYPFLMIDRLTEIVPHESAVAIKNVSVNEPQFQGHFPERPIMPGVLIVEAMAQAAACLVRAFAADRRAGADGLFHEHRRGALPQAGRAG